MQQMDNHSSHQVNNVSQSSLTAFLGSSFDKTMAAQQLRYDSLSANEKQKQEQWVQGHLKRICPARYGWRREGKGYRCQASNHYVTDQLVAEGKGGYLQGQH
ncbi:hypothetical protein B0J14DRAFT_579716 [Halenospora varia]|nr:hypothetical protein B0J14DRAFT_579716 [Halenospora varia]